MLDEMLDDGIKYEACLIEYVSQKIRSDADFTSGSRAERRDIALFGNNERPRLFFTSGKDASMATMGE